MEKVTKEKLKHYFDISKEALANIRAKTTPGKEKEAKEVIEMVECYVKDAHYFEKKGDMVNAFGSLSYAYGWIDCAARLGIFKVTDRRLFTVDPEAKEDKK